MAKAAQCKTMTDTSLDKIMNKQEIIKRLNELYEPAAVQNWLNKRNKVFKARPIDLLDSGKFDQIESMIVELEHGLPN